MHLTKHHGLANDFLVVLEATNGPLTEAPEVARRSVPPSHRRGRGRADLGSGERHGRRLLPTAQCRWLRGRDLRQRTALFGAGLAPGRGRGEGTVNVSTQGGTRAAVASATDDPLTLTVSTEMGAITEGPELPKSGGGPGLHPGGHGFGGQSPRRAAGPWRPGTRPGIHRPDHRGSSGRGGGTWRCQRSRHLARRWRSTGDATVGARGRHDRGVRFRSHRGCVGGPPLGIGRRHRHGRHAGG